MLVSKNNWLDVRKYYEGTYVKFNETGEELFAIKEVNSECLIASSLKTGELVGYIYEDNPELKYPAEIDYIIPKKAAFTYGKMSALLYRIPARMWKKGVSNQNTGFQKLKENGWLGSDFSTELLECFVNKPNYYSFNGALQTFAVDEKQLSVALSPRFSLSRIGYLYVDTCLIGKYVSSKKILTVKSLFELEIKTLIPDVQLKVLV